MALAACAAPAEDDAWSSTEASALAEAEDDFARLLPLVSRQVAEKGGAKPASLQMLGSGRGNAATLCSALGTATQARRELPNFYLFVGASAGAAVGLGVTEGAETVWDLTHQQEAERVNAFETAGTRIL